jgi:hypothetical protein
MTGGVGGVKVLAAATVEFDRPFERYIDEADGKEGLGLAQDSRAAAEVTTLVLLDLRSSSVDDDGRYRPKAHHLCLTSSGYDPPGVDEAIQNLRLNIQVLS